MNALPRVTVKPEKGGWSVVCAACGWERFEHARPLLDKAAREHQGKCRPGGRRGPWLTGIRRSESTDLGAIRGTIEGPLRPQTKRLGPAAKRDRANDHIRLRSCDRMSIVAPVEGRDDGPTPYFSDDQTTLWLGDALEVLQDLPDASVDCCVTSPPYFGLRDYGIDGQYGLEASPAEYVETMRALFAEVRRVLADDGTLWLNIGDSYSGAGPSGAAYDSETTRRRAAGNGTDGNFRVSKRLAERDLDYSRKKPKPKGGIPSKNLFGIPWRTAFALQDDGWILRAEIIWAKRNFMPEAVTDRVTRAHEQVFMLTKSPRYWYDADAIREESDPDQQAHNERYAKVYAAQADRAATTGQPGNVNSAGIHSRPGKPGRNARSVWSISAQPFAEAHFATMPPALAEKCVMAGCKPGGTVLDPFSGSGTTGLAAAKHGRKYVGIDLNADYLDLSLRTRLAQPGLDFGEGIA